MRRRAPWTFFAGAAVTLVAATAFLLLRSPTSIAPTDDDRFELDGYFNDGEELGNLPHALGMSEEEAVDYVLESSRGEQLRPLGLAQYPNSFAGAWMDPELGPAWSIAFTEDAAPRANHLASRLGLTGIRVVTADYSLLELESVAEAIDSEEFIDQGYDVVSWGVSESANRVVVETTNETDAKRLRELFSSEPRIAIDTGFAVSPVSR